MTDRPDADDAPVWVPTPQQAARVAALLRPHLATIAAAEKQAQQQKPA